MLPAKRAVQDIDQMQQFEEGLHRIREYREISPSIVRLFILFMTMTDSLYDTDDSTTEIFEPA